MRLHIDGPECPECNKKLLTAHPYLSSWFKKKVKKQYPNAHISWAWRGEADQNQFLKEGKTTLPFPRSPHNKSKPDGTKCAMALDLFLIDDDGSARFPPLWYAKLNTENEADREPIRWGGKFKSIGDGDHFELRAGPLPEGG